MLSAGLFNEFQPTLSSNLVLAVRNTFIEVKEEQTIAGPQRSPVRRHSVPPTFRAETSEASGWEGDESDGEEDQQICPQRQDAKRSVLGRPRVVPKDFVTDMVLPPARDAITSDADESSCAERTREAPSDLSTDASFNSASEQHVKLRSSAQLFVPGPSSTSPIVSSLPQAAMMSSMLFAPSGPSLTLAPMWGSAFQPQSPSTCVMEPVAEDEGPPKGDAFHNEVLVVATEVGQLLQELECAPEMQTRISGATGDTTVTLTLAIGLEHQGSADQLVESAKTTLYSRTNRSRGVCLLGYKKHPFDATPTGFTARVGSVCRKRQACRQFFAGGACKYGKECWWAHAESTCLINVTVEMFA